MNPAAKRLTGQGSRRIWIAMLIVAVVAGIAAVVWVNRSPERPQEASATGGKFRISTRLDSTPVPRWTLRAADLSDKPGAVLLSAPQTLDRYYGYGSPMDAGTMIVAATAVPEPGAGENAGLPVGPVQLHGIDPDTGEVRWTTDVGELSSCDEQVFDGQLACRGTHRVLVIEAATGAVLGDHTTDFEVMDVALRDGVVSVAGRTADWMTAVVTRGAVSDIAATWRRTYPTPVPGDPVTPGIDSSARDYFRDGHDRDVRVYDLRTGEPLFTGPVAYMFDGGIIASQVFEAGWSAGRVTLLDRNGHPITEVNNPSFLLEWYPTATATPPPILTGESAYERTTGRVLWTNAQIGMDEPTGRTSAIQGVVNNTVIVRSLDGSELTGLDLTDGHRIWQQPIPFANTSRYSRYDGITDASHLILTDGTTVHAIDAGDGSPAWSMPLPPSGRPSFRSAVKAVGGRMVAVTAHEFTGYAAA
ncbi:PQQ-binding-like beta-propeller repeat protein [Nocardia iowensis]|uniref:PQQ-binding-like beta-propeller repeat protein n=1 Tax=Nocardia iowensis TaxID=204891 RepID=A0ABX8RMY4_NOCIO|nr:PQQ-binding-like beta-propeller repeat protein [Nocardia iowensis]QXN89660.1 PQQ-binding-like beta-propeller repeat protein [Nocardia iowensis]